MEKLKFINSYPKIRYLSVRKRIRTESSEPDLLPMRNALNVTFEKYYEIVAFCEKIFFSRFGRTL